MFLRNVAMYLRVYTTPKLRRTTTTSKFVAFSIYEMSLKEICYNLKIQSGIFLIFIRQVYGSNLGLET
jgi:hypothetical protein